MFRFKDFAEKYGFEYSAAENRVFLNKERKKVSNYTTIVRDFIKAGFEEVENLMSDAQKEQMNRNLSTFDKDYFRFTLDSFDGTAFERYKNEIKQTILDSHDDGITHMLRQGSVTPLSFYSSFIVDQSKADYFPNIETVSAKKKVEDKPVSLPVQEAVKEQQTVREQDLSNTAYMNQSLLLYFGTAKNEQELFGDDQGKGIFSKDLDVKAYASGHGVVELTPLQIASLPVKWRTQYLDKADQNTLDSYNEILQDRDFIKKSTLINEELESRYQKALDKTFESNQEQQPESDNLPGKDNSNESDIQIINKEIEKKLQDLATINVSTADSFLTKKLESFKDEDIKANNRNDTLHKLNLVEFYMLDEETRERYRAIDKGRIDKNIKDNIENDKNYENSWMLSLTRKRSKKIVDTILKEKALQESIDKDIDSGMAEENKESVLDQLYGFQYLYGEELDNAAKEFGSDQIIPRGSDHKFEGIVVDDKSYQKRMNNLSSNFETTDFFKVYGFIIDGIERVKSVKQSGDDGVGNVNGRQNTVTTKFSIIEDSTTESKVSIQSRVSKATGLYTSVSEHDVAIQASICKAKGLDNITVTGSKNYLMKAWKALHEEGLEINVTKNQEKLYQKYINSSFNPSKFQGNTMFGTTDDVAFLRSDKKMRKQSLIGEVSKDYVNAFSDKYGDNMAKSIFSYIAPFTSQEDDLEKIIRSVKKDFFRNNKGHIEEYINNELRNQDLPEQNFSNCKSLNSMFIQLKNEIDEDISSYKLKAVSERLSNAITDNMNLNTPIDLEKPNGSTILDSIKSKLPSHQIQNDDWVAAGAIVNDFVSNCSNLSGLEKLSGEEGNEEADLKRYESILDKAIAHDYILVTEGELPSNDYIDQCLNETSNKNMLRNIADRILESLKLKKTEATSLDDVNYVTPETLETLNPETPKPKAQAIPEEFEDYVYKQESEVSLQEDDVQQEVLPEKDDNDSNVLNFIDKMDEYFESKEAEEVESGRTFNPQTKRPAFA